jgi:dCMP deaminase
VRPTRDEYFLALALESSKRATCSRRAVGCILVDARGHILGHGYNGTPRGFPHCVSEPCAGAECASGEGLELCEAVHAEANALIKCNDPFEIKTAYCTTAPCIHCVKLLLNTSCERIVFNEDYPHEDSSKLWLKGGRTWEQL